MQEITIGLFTDHLEKILFRLELVQILYLQELVTITYLVVAEVTLSTLDLEMMWFMPVSHNLAQHHLSRVDLGRIL